MELNYFLNDENDTVTFGILLSKVVKPNTTIFLEGSLGVGKTTLTRGFVQELGYEGIVKSPTFTLVEEYTFKDFVVYHFDLYRLIAPEELEFMGVRDYFKPNSIRLIEWPSKGKGYIPEHDIRIYLEYVSVSRKITITSYSQQGDEELKALEPIVPTSFKLV